MRVAAFTGGLTVPSARFRVRQYVPLLAGLGVAVDEFGLGGGGAYPPQQGWQRPLWALRRLTALAHDVQRARRHDAIWLQREMISSFYTLERFTTRPRVLDVDDSIHLLRDGACARRLAMAADRVIAGNDFLADWYRQFHADVVILPTGVDADRYKPAARTSGETLTIGWIGTSANFPYLEALVPALARILASHADAHVRIISDRAPDFGRIPGDRWSFQGWSEASEIEDIQSMDIGIMPLADSLWARGKCSFKMLQYMACGLPVVVSPVGMNAEVLAHDEVGLAATSLDEWHDALDYLVRSPQVRGEMGAKGRTVIEQYYATRVLAPQLARHLGQASGAHP